MRWAATLPEGTFGRAYGDFMGARGFRADDRPPVRFVDDEELAYVATRAREARPSPPHDLSPCSGRGPLLKATASMMDVRGPVRAQRGGGQQQRTEPAWQGGCL